MTRTTLAIIVAINALFASLSPVEAGRSAQTVTVALRLQVYGHPAPNTTFWVAYGPASGKFWIAQLQERGGGLYTVRRTVPLHAHTMLAYLSGTGAVSMPYGKAPGDPVITIRSMGPGTLQDLSVHTVQWHVPFG